MSLLKRSATRKRKPPRPALNTDAAYSMDDAALIVGVSWRTIWRATQSGALRHCRIGRRIVIRGDQIAAFLRASEVEAA